MIRMRKGGTYAEKIPGIVDLHGTNLGYDDWAVAHYGIKKQRERHLRMLRQYFTVYYPIIADMREKTIICNCEKYGHDARTGCLCEASIIAELLARFTDEQLRGMKHYERQSDRLPAVLRNRVFLCRERQDRIDAYRRRLLAEAENEDLEYFETLKKRWPYLDPENDKPRAESRQPRMRRDHVAKRSH